MHTELEELLKERTEFTPQPVYSADGDFLSVFVRDSSCYAERVDETLTIYKDDDSDELVGFKLKGMRTLLKKMDASGIMVQDKVSMTALFLGWAAVSKIRAENLDILHYLIDHFGNITAQHSKLDTFDSHDSRCPQ